MRRRGESFGLVAGFGAAGIAVRGGSGCGDDRRLCGLDGHAEVGAAEQLEEPTLGFGALVRFSTVKLVYLREQPAALRSVGFEGLPVFFSASVDRLAKGTKTAIEPLQSFDYVFWSFDCKGIMLDPVGVRLQRESIRKHGRMPSHDVQKGSRECGGPFGVGGRGKLSQLVHTLREPLHDAQVRTLRVSVVQSFPESGKAGLPLTGNGLSPDDAGIDDSPKTLAHSGVLGGNLRQLVVQEPAILQNRPDHVRETIIIVMMGHCVDQLPGRGFRGYPLRKQLLTQ